MINVFTTQRCLCISALLVLPDWACTQWPCFCIWIFFLPPEYCFDAKSLHLSSILTPQHCFLILAELSVFDFASPAHVGTPYRIVAVRLYLQLHCLDCIATCPNLGMKFENSIFLHLCIIVIPFRCFDAAALLCTLVLLVYLDNDCSPQFFTYVNWQWWFTSQHCSAWFVHLRTLVTFCHCPCITFASMQFFDLLGSCSHLAVAQTLQHKFQYLRTVCMYWLCWCLAML